MDLRGRPQLDMAEQMVKARTRPWRSIIAVTRAIAVGGPVWIRSGARGGQYEGEVIEIGRTYVRPATGDGPIFLPNTQVLAAATGPVQAGKARSSTSA